MKKINRLEIVLITSLYYITKNNPFILFNLDDGNVTLNKIDRVVSHGMNLLITTGFQRS